MKLTTARQLAARKPHRPAALFSGAGDKPRTRRNDYGLTLRDCVEIAGVSIASMSRAENGLEPSLAVAMRLARFYETTVEEIWGAEFKP